MSPPLVAYVRDTDHVDPRARLEAETSTLVLGVVVAGAALDEAITAGPIDPAWLLRRAGELQCAGRAALDLLVRLRALAECGGVAH